MSSKHPWVTGEIVHIIIHLIGSTTADRDSQARVKVATSVGNIFVDTAEPDDCDDREDARLSSPSEMDLMDEVQQLGEEGKSLPWRPSEPTSTDSQGNPSGHNDKPSQSHDEGDWEFV